MFDEDTERNLRLCIELSPQLCVSCDDYHLSFATRRASRKTMGADIDRQNFVSLLTKAIEPHAISGSPPSVLIAGAADTGVLKSVLDAAVSVGGVPFATSLRIKVVDLCQTPLEMCRQYAEGHGLSVEVSRTDLVDLEASETFGLIVMHNVLAFFPRPERQARMVGLMQRLQARGKIVSVTQVGILPESTADLESAIEKQVDALSDFVTGNGLAEDADALTARVAHAVRRRRRFPAPFEDSTELRDFYEAVGLEIVDQLSSDMSAAEPRRRYGGRTVVLCQRREG